MINVYIVSGFLGAGKTTFIQKLLKEKKFGKVMLLENEFGEVGVDGAFFDSALNVKEINNGCICCSLQGDFESALEEIEKMDITDLIIEPSGVGKLSDILKVVTADEDFRVISHICIVDVKTCKKYHKNFKEYFDDQVKAANAIILSHVDVAEHEKIHEAIHVVEEINDDVTILTKPMSEYPIDELLDLIVKGHIEIEEHHHEHHHHHDHECCCCCGHDHDHEHHHDHDHEHEHHHDHDHEHHHHHHDDETFKNMIIRTDYVFTKEEIEKILSDVEEDIIRIKGYVNSNEGTLYVNYVLNEYNVYLGEKRDDSLISVIGTEINRDKYNEVFHG
ncbi:MAG: GTP-binding protein [Erysipelotrichaceae bacterium]|nr:GTP-binding protein [Erysipelotrichaceae bacterium]